MKQTKSAFMILFRKELRQTFFSPVGYIISGIFLFVTGWFFFSFPPFFVIGRADMQGFFRMIPFLFAIVIPAVTMRLYSEEYRSGSWELLETLPLSDRDILLGKFLSSLTFVCFMLLPTLFYPLSISLVGKLEWGPVLGGYAGTVLLAAALISLGIFCSSLTENQIVSFIVAVLLSFFFILIDKMVIILPQAAGSVFQYISAAWHFQNITKGILDSRNLLFFVSMTSVFLYSTWMVNRERQ